MRKTLTTLGLTVAASASLMLGAGAASAEYLVNTEVRPPAGPCSDLPNAFVEPGGRVGADLTTKCFE